MLNLAKKEEWQSYVRLLKYCLPYKKRLAYAIACMVLSAIFGIIPPWLIKNVVDDVLIQKKLYMLNILCVGVVVLYILKAVFAYANLYLVTWVGQKVVIDIRLVLYDHTQRLSLLTLYKKRSGEFLSRITNDVATLQNILGNVIVDLVVQGVTFFGIIGLLVFLNWKLTLATFTIIPVAVLVIDKAASKLRRVGSVIQERLAMGATREEPQSWWLSVVGDYYDFGVSLEVLDDEAVSGTLVSRKLYDINYFVSTNKLLIMTSGGEWLLSPGAAGGALTPSNVDVGLQGNRGCARIEPVVIGNMVLFVQSRGLRIRDLGYEYVSDSYTGTDLTMMARHLFEGGTIAHWAFAQEPDSMCWTVMGDGSLIALTYIREQEVVAWGRFPTDGFVESVAAVVSEGADDVYLCVRRGEERFIELLSPRGVDSPEEAFFVDAGVTARFETPSREVSGLSHLEGRGVVCLADGNVIEGLTVENGKVTLPHAASVVHAGLPYAALLETLELVYGRQDGTQLTRRSRISSVTARVERTRGLFIGTEVSQKSSRDTSDKTGLTAVEEALLSEAPQRTDERYNEPVGLYTKDYKLHLSSGYGQGRITCWAPYPLPCSILALVAEVETGG